MRRRSDHGFTLIELVITITILGILAAIVTVAIGDSTEEAARNTCSAQIDAVQAAIRRYVDDEGGRVTQFDSLEDVNSRVVPTYLAEPVVQVDDFTISVTDGVVTGTYEPNDEACP